MCFAYKQNRMGKWGCETTTNNCNGENTGCPFFKTLGQHITERESALRRIATLSKEQQKAISDNFYGGEMPWKNYLRTSEEAENVRS